MKYIFSTLTGSQKYPLWARVAGNDMPRMKNYVFIQGGANLPSKVLVTPKGVATKITDEEFDRLNQCPAFQKHVDNGFLTVEDLPQDADEVAEDMEPKDTSAPKVAADFEAGGKKPPTTGEAMSDEPGTASVNSSQRPAQAEKAEKAEKAESSPEPPARRRRGRPPGSKNKTTGAA